MSEALRIAREALGDRQIWVVGGATRDRALGRDTADLDLVVDGDPEQAARALARAARGAGEGAACFPLSEEFGAWRVVARDGTWQADVEALREGSIAADLRERDFTVNAIAEPLAGGPPIDPLGGLDDLRARRLRTVSERSFSDDPLRVLRLVRIALELGLRPDPQALAQAARASKRLADVSPERVFAELQRILACDCAREGLDMLLELGATEAVLPELHALQGVEQSRYHHRDVYGHTLEVLQRTIELEADPGAILGEEHSKPLLEVLGEPLADGVTRAGALRWGALLHDAAKPLTRGVRPIDGRVTFIGHDLRGKELAREVLTRLRCSVHLREHVGSLVLHHLRLGFLVHSPQPLEQGQLFDYLNATGGVVVDVTLLSVADRLATRGKGSQKSIEAHLQLARQVLPHALRWHGEGAPAPLIRGDELAAELGIAPGPRLGELLGELVRAQYIGEVRTREQAIAFARSR